MTSAPTDHLTILFVDAGAALGGVALRRLDTPEADKLRRRWCDGLERLDA